MTVDLDLTDAEAVRRRIMRPDGRVRSVHCQQHPETGGVSFRLTDLSGPKKRIIYIRCGITPSSSRQEVLAACEVLGSPPPWLTESERKLWRRDWKKWHGVTLRTIWIRTPHVKEVSNGSLEDLADPRESGNGSGARPMANNLWTRPKSWKIPHATSARHTTQSRIDDQIVRLMEQARRNVDRERSRKR